MPRISECLYVPQGILVQGTITHSIITLCYKCEMTVRKQHHPYVNINFKSKLFVQGICVHMQDSQTKLHRMHIMILIREHQQQHCAGHDESAVR